MKKTLIPLLFLISFSSCSKYYKAVTASQPADAKNMSDLKMQNKYFILRNGSEAFSIANISISADQKYLNGNLEPLSSDHMLYFNKIEKGKMTYRKAHNAADDQSAVLNEVHIYIAPENSIAAGTLVLPLDKINKTEIIEVDAIKTKRSKTSGLIIGISTGVVGFVGVLYIVAAAVTSSIF